MTNTVVSSKQARDNFSDLLGRVRYGDEVITIEKKGRAYGILISPSEYERYRKFAKQQFFKTVEQIQNKNKKFSEKEVFKDVTEAVKTERNEMNDSKR